MLFFVCNKSFPFYKIEIIANQTLFILKELVQKGKLMKLKKLLGIVGLTAFVGIAAFAGAALTNSKGQEVKAATEETTFYVDVQNSLWGYSNIDEVKVHLWGETPGDVWIYDAGSGLSKVTVKGVNYVSFSIADHAGVSGFDVYCWNKDSAGNSTVWTEFSQFSEGQNLIIVGSNGKWTENQPVTLGTLELGEMHTVTKYAVLDGVLQETPLGTDSIGDGNTYDVPAKPALENLQHFAGWYADQACTEEYVAKAVTADMSIYAKVESIEVDSYFYWTDKDSADLKDGRVHFFGDYVNSWDEGPHISDYLVSGGALSLNNEGCLYKIPAPSKGDYKVVLHNGDVQTFDMEITLGAVHYTKFDNTGGGKHYYSYSASDVMGLAADFLIEAEAIRNAATYKGLNYSVCGIGEADAKKLVGLYNALSDEVRGFVDNSCAYTYNPAKSAEEIKAEEPYDQTYVTYRAIMLRLAEDYELDIVGDARAFNSSNGINNPVTLITVVTLIAVASISLAAIIIIVNKKKEN